MDMSLSLEEQLPPGPYRNAARKMLNEKKMRDEPFNFR